jgi:hypothetical protein
MGEPGSPRDLSRGVDSPGEESRSVRRCGSDDRGAAVLRPDQAMERPCGPRAEQHHREKTWLTSSAPHKRSGIPGEEKETLAFRKDDTSRPGNPADGGAAEGTCLCRPRGAGEPDRDKKRCIAGHAGDRSSCRYPTDRRWRGLTRPWPGHQGKRCRTSHAPQFDMRRDKQRQVRPG